MLRNFMYQITFDYNTEHPTIVHCYDIIHDIPLNLKLVGVKEKNLSIEYGEKSIKTLKIEVFNTKYGYVPLLNEREETQVLNVRFVDDSIYLKIQENLFIYDYYYEDTFHYIKKIAAASEREWLNFNTEKERGSWLFSCYQFNREPNFINKNVVLEGKYTTTKCSFLCEIGEQVIGIGGYLGSNLDALEDCLNTNFYKELDKVILNITWNNFNIHNFETKEFIVEILEESSYVNLMLSERRLGF